MYIHIYMHTCTVIRETVCACIGVCICVHLFMCAYECVCVLFITTAFLSPTSIRTSLQTQTTSLRTSSHSLWISSTTVDVNMVGNSTQFHGEVALKSLLLQYYCVVVIIDPAINNADKYQPYQDGIDQDIFIKVCEDSLIFSYIFCSHVFFRHDSFTNV